MNEMHYILCNSNIVKTIPHFNPRVIMYQYPKIVRALDIISICINSTSHMNPMLILAVSIKTVSKYRGCSPAVYGYHQPQELAGSLPKGKHIHNNWQYKYVLRPQSHEPIHSVLLSQRVNKKDVKISFSIDN